MKKGIELIAEERQRQINIEGYNEQHDSQHPASEFIYAAIAYVESAKVGVNCREMGNTDRLEISQRKAEMGKHFPFGWLFKPSTDVRDLIKAGALIAAAIDRLQRETDVAMDRYKEAMARFKEWERKHPNGYVIREMAEYVFPDLAESEEEDMWSTIMSRLGVAYSNNLFSEEDFDKMCAFIEKQKEQKPSAQIVVKAGLKLDKDGNQWSILAGDNIQEGICGFGDTIDEALYEFLKEVLIMANSPQLKEQKPAEWSEEDEKRLKAIIRLLTYERDECGLLRQDGFTGSDLIHFLESIRPHPHWMPSEEQMRALGDSRPNNLADGILIHSLYNDLHKLM